MNRFGGSVPNNHKDFQSLPGVGPYIAGAVMSIAYNLPIPAVDGNAYRVVSRIKSINLPFNSCKNDVSGFLSNHISLNRPGDFNQAIMDVGRVVCTPKKPSCEICPIQNNCSAFINNAVDKYPFKAKHEKKPHYFVAVGVVWKKNRILISKRRENGLLGGLWEFPGGKIQPGENANICVIRKLNEILGVSVKPVRLLKQIKHAYSHFSITLDAYHCDFVDGSPRALQCDNWQWILPNKIADLPFSKVNHKLFDQIKGY
jgi:A/G-specific adenine glycosylase